MLVAATGEIANLAQLTDGASIAGSANRQRVFVTTAEGLVTLRRDGSIASTITCGCEMTGLTGLNGDVFRLTGFADGPVWIFDSNPAGEPRTLFVPFDGAQESR